MELTTILPGMVLGPVMTGTISGSVELIFRMLTGQVPALPRVGFSLVDVRDLAVLHVLAMRAPEAAGQRFLGAGDFLWMAEMAKLLRDNLGQQASKVPTRRIPDLILRTAALFQYEARFMASMLGAAHQLRRKQSGCASWLASPASLGSGVGLCKRPHPAASRLGLKLRTLCLVKRTSDRNACIRAKLEVVCLWTVTKMLWVMRWPQK